MKQAAIYVRVSTQQQKEGDTIESQKALLFQFAKEKGVEIPSEWVFEDNGISGSILARPGLERLRDLASEGIIEQVFILSPDRLSRKYAYQAILMEEFKNNNVSVIFQNSPPPRMPQIICCSKCKACLPSMNELKLLNVLVGAKYIRQNKA